MNGKQEPREVMMRRARVWLSALSVGSPMVAHTDCRIPDRRCGSATRYSAWFREIMLMNLVLSADTRVFHLPPRRGREKTAPNVAIPRILRLPLKQFRRGKIQTYHSHIVIHAGILIGWLDSLTWRRLDIFIQLGAALSR